MANDKTHHKPTQEEYKKWESKDKPNTLLAIRKAHGNTMRKVAAMQDKIIYNDKGK